MHPKRPAAAVGLALCAIAGLAACGATHKAPTPPPPEHTAIVYEIRGSFPDDGWVWRADPTGAHPTRLTRGQTPAISPDGEAIAFIRYQPKPAAWSVWTTDLNGAGARQIYTYRNVQDAILSVVWSPDSQRLAVVDQHGILTVSRDGTRTTKTTDAVIASEQVSFSPDSTHFAYADATSGRIVIVPIEGGSATPVTDGPSDLAPTWGSSGIAFAHWPGPGHLGDIWIVQPDGTDAHQLTHTNAGIQPVAFSADGKRLIAQNPATHNGRIWTIDTQTGTARDLTGWVGDLFPAGVSQDGTAVLASIGCGGTATNRGIVELIATTSGRARTIIRGPCRANWNA